MNRSVQLYKHEAREWDHGYELQLRNGAHTCWRFGINPLLSQRASMLCTCSRGVLVACWCCGVISCWREGLRCIFDSPVDERIIEAQCFRVHGRLFALLEGEADSVSRFQEIEHGQ